MEPDRAYKPLCPYLRYFRNAVSTNKELQETLLFYEVIVVRFLFAMKKCI